MDNFSHLDDGERLVAKQAVLTLRAFKLALRSAPPDRRLPALERAVRRRGHEHLRIMMAAAIVAQKPTCEPYAGEGLDLAAIVPRFTDPTRDGNRMADT